MEKEPEVGGHGLGRIRGQETKGISSTSIRSPTPRLQWSPAMAAGVPGWVWCVDLGLALFPTFHLSDFLFRFRSGCERKGTGGRRLHSVRCASRFVRVEFCSIETLKKKGQVEEKAPFFDLALFALFSSLNCWLIVWGMVLDFAVSYILSLLNKCALGWSKTLHSQIRSKKFNCGKLIRTDQTSVFLDL
jgi:hypothetical protein